jgi:isoquinoline 1-oxidoreductase alpha subunit
VPNYSFILNGKPVTVTCPGDVRLLWVLRDILGVNGPKYGCGLDVCKACTCHIKRAGLPTSVEAFNPCSVTISEIHPTDEITTIEGLAATVGRPLHPMQEAWIEHDVAQCGYCQPGQIMAAVALVKEAQAQGRPIDDAALDTLRNVCRCGTYYRIRQAIKAGAANM